jgi:hypothetical protein
MISSHATGFTAVSDHSMNWGRGVGHFRKAKMATRTNAHRAFDRDLTLSNFSIDRNQTYNLKAKQREETRTKQNIR